VTDPQPTWARFDELGSVTVPWRSWLVHGYRDDWGELTVAVQRHSHDELGRQGSALERRELGRSRVSADIVFRARPTRKAFGQLVAGRRGADPDVKVLRDRKRTRRQWNTRGGVTSQIARGACEGVVHVVAGVSAFWRAIVVQPEPRRISVNEELRDAGAT
jgi:hypothetical protein